MLATDGQIGWLGPAEEAPDPGPGVEVVDAGGTTAVAGLVDAHRHLTLPGGAHWIDRAADPTPRLLATAEDNARLLGQAGVRWARDVGAPVRDGRALSLTVRERWRGRPGDPCVRVAGGWLARTGSLPAGCRSSQRRGPAPGRRPRPARGRRRPGQAVPGRPDRDSSPLAPPTRSTSRSRPSMPAGATVTTPSSLLPGPRSPPGRCLEHGFRLEPGLARVMTAAGDGPGGDPGRAGVLEQLRGDHPAGPPGLGRGPGGAGRAAGGGPGVGPKLAHGAGVLLCAGTDFGGGWLRSPGVAAGRARRRCPGRGGPADFLLVHRDPLSEPGVTVAGVAHQLVPLTHSAVVTTSSHLPIRRQATPPRLRAQRCAGGRDRDRTPLLAPTVTGLHTTTPQVDT